MLTVQQLIENRNYYISLLPTAKQACENLINNMKIVNNARTTPKSK